MIREATLVDVSELVALGRRFLSSTEYHKRIAENPEQMATLATQLIEQPAGVVFVSEDKGGAVTGMIGLLVFAHPLSGELTAGELFWFVEPEARGSADGVRLFHRAKQWAAEHGAKHFQMIAPTDKVAAFYERMGMARVETAYQMEIVS